MNEEVLQVLPINDIKEHDETFDWVMGFIPVSRCSCIPKSNLNIESPGNWVIVHSSFDGREAIEEFNAIINQPKL